MSGRRAGYFALLKTIEDGHIIKRDILNRIQTTRSNRHKKELMIVVKSIDETIVTSRRIIKRFDRQYPGGIKK